MKQYAKIEKAELYALKIPFRMDFTHAMASRSSSDSLILKIEGQGKRGFGEAIVRDYVSGEIGKGADLLENAKKIIARILEPLMGKDISWEEGKEHLDSLALESHGLPLLCAVETALLDMFCHRSGEDIYGLLKKEPLKQTIQYGGILPMLPLSAAEYILDLYEKVNIRSMRIKVGTDLDYNEEILKLSREKLGRDFDLRVDANASWSLEMALENLALCRKYGISRVEEPFGRDREEIFFLLKDPESRDFQFVADESALTVSDIEAMAKKRSYHMINLRLSKNGGLIKVLKMAEIADKGGLQYQVGCHVGETGILSASGRVAASILPKAVYVDGSYDSYLLSQNITSENFSFGFGGMAEIIRGQGLGFTVDETRLGRLSIGKARCLPRMGN
ncbi:MAG: enolase C-terminal domain-like protein [Thermodesulfobacteriota bacterium]|nr:enolase C-terminal domain-like protein [Thermodesulfobacteriota bacterium]